MPKVVDIKNMQVGKKGGGRHWTKKEVEARKESAQKLQRKSKVKLEPPEWLKNDISSMIVWNKILNDAKEIELLDNLDSYALATLCKLESEKERALTNGDVDKFEKLSKTSLMYTKELGLSARSRAALAKKKEPKKEKDPLTEKGFGNV